MRRYEYRCKKKAGKFSIAKSKEPMYTREFKRYKADLPIGPLETEEDTSRCDDTVTQNLTDTQDINDDFQDVSTVCTCTKSVYLDPILIPMEEEPPIEAVSSEGDNMVHTVRCSEHVQRARIERNNALHLARLYCDRVDNLIKEKRDIQHSLKAQVDKTREFWRNQIIEGNSRAGKILRAALVRKNKSLL